MNRFRVVIILNSGNIVDAKVTARDKNEAIKRLQSQSEVADFIGESRVILIDARKIENEKSDNTRFLLQESEKENHFVCADILNNTVVVFEKNRFNESQQVTFLNDVELSAGTLATILREMGDWLAENHKDKI